MNKKKLTVILSILLGALLTVFAVFTASAYTDGDPLITLSYLQEIFAPSLKQQVVDEVAAIYENSKYVPEPVPETVPAVSDVPEAAVPVDGVSNTYTLLELNLGQTVTANSICEFIVRPGSKVTAVSPFPAQGIADITNGIEVLNGEMISINAYCLIPRGGDGRGMTVVGEKAYIMIRGDYTIG